MEIYERIRDLRKNHLKMSADEFGQRLGVNRDMIYNIELNRLARPDQKSSLYKLICREFRVNEDWLLNGNEPMFVQTPDSVMEELRQKYELDDFTYSLVYEYLKLDPAKRDIFREFLQRVMNHMTASDSGSTTFYDAVESAKVSMFNPVRDVNAAREIPGASNEDKKHDDDMMSDENF